MTATFPFLTAYDPPGTSEGTLDPMGLYQIADQLAVLLVPAIRERMQRVRFLTAMTVGALVTGELESDVRHGDVSPSLVWEWLVVESLIRQRNDSLGLWGVPGTQVARRALAQHGYLDVRSYLKTPRIFGFHGVYKRLAMHLGLVDVHLGPGPHAEGLVKSWAKGRGWGDVEDARPVMHRWTDAVRRSLAESPPRTKPGWSGETWSELADAFAPEDAAPQERRFLRDLLHGGDEGRLSAFPSLWRLQSEFEDGEFREELLHDRLEAAEPGYAPLLAAIRAYEGFSRCMMDAFDVLSAEAALMDARGFEVPRIARDLEFLKSVKGLHEKFEAAHHALGGMGMLGAGTPILFLERFRVFAEPMEAGDCALALCAHHEMVQRKKSVDGKRPWFDRLGPDRIYLRHAYRESRRPIEPGHYVHEYRGKPIRRFFFDLS